MINLLKAVTKAVKEDIADWRTRNNRVKEAPFPADYPCYYCAFIEDRRLGGTYEESKQVCKLCIHNDKHILLEMMDEQYE